MNRHLVVLNIVAASVALFLSGCTKTEQKNSADLTQPPKVSVRFEPNPPVAGKENAVHVQVTDASGNPIKDADVNVQLVMPMGQMDMRESADLKWAGTEYSGKISASMAGSWDVVVETKRDGKTVSTEKSKIEAVNEP
ncbi:MAG: FixH family protein [Candidatus Korobacteraceae bacterium]